MIFRCFSTGANYLYDFSNEINNYIEGKETKGFQVVDKQVLLENSGDNSLIKPTILVSIWMEKKDDLQKTP